MKNLNWRFVWQYGLAAGLFISITTLVFYVFYETIFTNYWLMTISGIAVMLATIFICIWSGITYRKQQDNIISLNDAFIVVFSIFMIMSVMNTATSWLIPNVIDKEYPANVTKVLKQTVANQMEKFGADDSMIEKQMESFSEEKFRPDLYASLKSIGISLAIGAVLSVIIALFIKKNSQDLIKVE